MSVFLSVIIPAFQSAKTIPALLFSLKNQTRPPDEIIVVDDDSSDKTASCAKSFGVNVVRNETNRGPAYARNCGIKLSQGEILAFVDADCVCASDWLEKIEAEFENEGKNVLMGKVMFDPRTLFERAVCDLGFPAGGSVGFENMWRVEKDGETRHLSTCNFSVRKKVFELYGYFDESFPFGGEDVELSERWISKGVRMYYRPQIKVEHPVMRGNLTSFVRWHFYRGQGNACIARNVKSISLCRMMGTRMWSFFHIVRNSVKTFRFSLVLLLMMIYSKLLKKL